MKLFKDISLKTTLMALVISFWTAAGLTCSLIWYSVVVWHAMSEHPIKYPASIVGGLVSLAVSMLCVFLYVKMRKGNWPMKGVLVDALASFLSLPVFFFWLSNIVYPWLERFI